MELLLRRAKFPAAAVREVCRQLSEEGLIDDHRYCRLYLGGQARLRPRSLRLMRRDLEREGIAPPIIDEVLAEMGEELKESDLALRAAEKKLRTSGGDPDRLRRLLAGRGFTRSAVEEALRALLGRSSEDEGE